MISRQNLKLKDSFYSTNISIKLLWLDIDSPFLCAPLAQHRTSLCYFTNLNLVSLVSQANLSWRPLSEFRGRFEQDLWSATNNLRSSSHYFQPSVLQNVGKKVKVAIQVNLVKNHIFFKIILIFWNHIVTTSIQLCRPTLLNLSAVFKLLMAQFSVKCASGAAWISILVRSLPWNSDWPCLAISSNISNQIGKFAKWAAEINLGLFLVRL